MCSRPVAGPPAPPTEPHWVNEFDSSSRPGCRSSLPGQTQGELTRTLGGAAVDGCLDQGEDGALQGGREQDFPSSSLRVGAFGASASRPACQILRAEDGSCDLGRHGSFLMQQISSQAHLRGISAGAA